jgi:hypothetical protein
MSIAYQKEKWLASLWHSVLFLFKIFAARRRTFPCPLKDDTRVITQQKSTVS